MTLGHAVWATTGLLFSAGLGGLILRRQFLAMLLALELMTNAVNVALVYEARLHSDPRLLAAVFVLLAVAASEAVVGLSFLLELHRRDGVGDSEELRELQG